MKAIKDGLHFVWEQVNWITATLSLKITPIAVVVWVYLQDFFNPTVPSIFYILTLGLLDIVTGIWASHREGKKITSEFFWRSKASVVVLFLIGVICMLIIDRMLKDIHQSAPAFALTTWMIFYAIYECISVLENIIRIGLLPGIKGFKTLFEKKITESVQEVAQAVADEKKEDK